MAVLFCLIKHKYIDITVGVQTLFFFCLSLQKAVWLRYINCNVCQYIKSFNFICKKINQNSIFKHFHWKTTCVYCDTLILDTKHVCDVWMEFYIHFLFDICVCVCLHVQTRVLLWKSTNRLSKWSSAHFFYESPRNSVEWLFTLLEKLSTKNG